MDCDGDGVAETDSEPFIDCDGDGIADPPAIDPPPEALINGVAGHPVSWCWGNSCADGWVDVKGAHLLPAVSDPSFVQVPRGTWIEGVQVWGPDGQEDSLDVAFEGLTIDAVPQDAVILIVSIRAMSGEDVTYAWHVVEPETSG